MRQAAIYQRVDRLLRLPITCRPEAATDRWGGRTLFTRLTLLTHCISRDKYREHILWNCPQVNGRRSHWMITQHWFWLWLGAIRHQAITFTNVDSAQLSHMASLGLTELTQALNLLHAKWANVKICVCVKICICVLYCFPSLSHRYKVMLIVEILPNGK